MADSTKVCASTKSYLLRQKLFEDVGRLPFTLGQFSGIQRVFFSSKLHPNLKPDQLGVYWNPEEYTKLHSHPTVYCSSQERWGWRGGGGGGEWGIAGSKNHSSQSRKCIFVIYKRLISFFDFAKICDQKAVSSVCRTTRRHTNFLSKSTIFTLNLSFQDRFVHPKMDFSRFSL